ncbi:stage III sporulation protein AF [Cohnella lupini]|uniref:Stage III sporulation protein AF n=1 Tax=Cohnella lupini TaxID=1294267 RepID=A0A3D9IIU3_9BACL|nr:stage III sporulation protein AF [Cohnella lupini]RED61658.1 stage III sporulation protein AF [Cohnella lupini]
MGLMEGLSHWLRQIIAVVLLAVLIDLLLPNRTMQRYVRLVAGLFILMTLATPVMNWMKGDFTAKLAEGLDAVERSPGDADAQLAMIEEQGAKLREKHGAEAAELVAVKLETAIRSEVQQSEQRGVRDVDVALGQGEDGSVTVTKVVVTLESERDERSGSNSTPVSEVESVADIDIRIELDGWPSESAATPSPEQDLAQDSGQPAMAQEEDADRDTRLRVSALVASRFGLQADIVEVKVPAMISEK